MAGEHRQAMTFRLHFQGWLIALAIAGFSHSAIAAAVRTNGYSTSFTNLPAITDWSTSDIPGLALEVTTPEALDATVQLVAPAAINEPLVADPADPPLSRSVASWCSSGAMYAQTFSAASRVTLLMCTLTNATGSNTAGVRLRYDHSKAGQPVEEVDGWRAYHRLSNQPIWTLIPELSSNATGRVSGEIRLNWPPGVALYVLWADDNASVTDGANQIDNFVAEALPVLPLVVTNQPVSQTNVVGTRTLLTVGVSGSVPAFQWQRDDGVGGWLNLAAGTSSSYTNLTTPHSAAGLYRVLITNFLGTVTSVVARLTVAPDNTGPRVLSAEVPIISGSNQIRVSFNERLASSSVEFSAATSNHFTVHILGSTASVPVTAAFYTGGSIPTNFSFATLRVGPQNWDSSGATDYVVTINGVTDQFGNAIAPDTRVGLRWPQEVPDLLGPDSLMHFHAAAVFEPDIYSQPWRSPAFAPGPWWGQAGGPFCGGVVLNAGCLGPYQFEMGYQPEPYLFRATFQWPANPGGSAVLRVVTSVDDGLVGYLNETEFLRVNAPLGEVTAAMRSSSDVAGPACISNNVAVSNLQPGTNWLAFAVLQTSAIGTATSGDAAFAMRLSASVLKAPPALPPESPAQLVTQRLDTNQFRLSWTGSGYALEFTTNLPASSLSPWLEVTNMSNPFTQATTGPQQFFRLRKGTP